MIFFMNWENKISAETFVMFASALDNWICVHSQSCSREQTQIFRRNSWKKLC